MATKRPVPGTVVEVPAETTVVPKPTPAKVEHFTPAERAARGKATRAEVSRSSHGHWEPSATRPDPIDDPGGAGGHPRARSSCRSATGGCSSRRSRSTAGAAAIMAADLAGGPRTGLHTQLCGDAHLMNFGTYAAPDRRMVFGINDFDETLPGPFEWDVKRLVASFAVAGRDRGFAPKVRASINHDVVRGYREAIAGFAEMRNLDVWYARLDIEQLVKDIQSRMSPTALARMEQNLEKARTKDSLKAFAKLTDGR